jgi:predicted glycoside hydrolase/deacetylase ChbG (UPF0249 family)
VKLLVVNADDFGLTEGVSRAILDCHRDGIVTSTSVLANGPAFDRTSSWLGDAPDLGAGAHLTVVGEDPPLLSAAEIPTLVDRAGRLRPSWRQFLPLAAAGRIDPADLRREFTAQLDRIEGAGIVVDHLDTHQNVHLWPSVRDVVLALGNERGVRSMRVTRSSAAGLTGLVVRRLAATLESRGRRAGWSFPDASAGLDGAGHLDQRAMIEAVRVLAGRTDAGAELATHPGEHGDPELERYRWGYEWGTEADALRAPEVRREVERVGFRLATFADLATSSR